MKYPWLKYSEQENGGYCLPCVLFSRSGILRSDPGILVSGPLVFFKALELLDKHMEKSYHKTAVVKMDAFVKVMTGQQPSIRMQLNSATMQRVANNRKELHSIIETIVLCKTSLFMVIVIVGCILNAMQVQVVGISGHSCSFVLLQEM